MSDDLFYKEKEPEPKKDPAPSDHPDSVFQDTAPTDGPYYQYVWDQQTPQQPQGGANGLAIASLVSGLISLLLCCCPYIAPLCGIAGIITAVLSRRDQPMSGLAIAGLVVSIIGLILSLLFLVYVFYIMSHPELYEEIMKEYYNMLESMEAEGGLLRLLPLRRII